MTNADTALLYMSAGVAVFPCCPFTKAPLTPNGFLDASAAPAVVRSMWTGRGRNAAVGLPCARNGLIALDADRHPGGGDGIAQLAGVCEQIGLDPKTVPNVLTAGGGIHACFSRPLFLDATRGKLAPDVDVRDNAYIIAAGSIMADGRRYELLNGTVEQFASAIGNRSLPELPPALAALVAQPPPPERRPFVRRELSADATKARLDGIISCLANARDGERNRLLHWAACRAAEMVRGREVPYDFAFDVLTEIGESIGLTTREVRATVRGALRRG